MKWFKISLLKNHPPIHICINAQFAQFTSLQTYSCTIIILYSSLSFVFTYLHLILSNKIEHRARHLSPTGSFSLSLHQYDFYLMRKMLNQLVWYWLFLSSLYGMLTLVLAIMVILISDIPWHYTELNFLFKGAVLH